MCHSKGSHSVKSRVKMLAPFGMHRTNSRATKVPSTLCSRGSDWRRETPVELAAKATSTWPTRKPCVLLSSRERTKGAHRECESEKKALRPKGLVACIT
jgi:hypothetical protein